MLHWTPSIASIAPGNLKKQAVAAAVVEKKIVRAALAKRSRDQLKVAVQPKSIELLQQP